MFKLNNYKIFEINFLFSVIEKNGNGFHSSRQLIDQRRLAGDLALGLALIGISLMIIAHECSNVDLQILEKAAKIGVVISTFALLLATLNYHWTGIKVIFFYIFFGIFFGIKQLLGNCFINL